MEQEIPQEIIDSASEKSKLPFDKAKQEAMIGHLLINEAFFLRSRGLVKAYWFEDGILGAIWDAFSAFYTALNRTPQMSELKSEFSQLPMDEASQFHHRIDLCIEMTRHYGLDLIRGQCGLWLKSVLIREAAIDLYALYNQKHVTQALEYVDKKFRQIQEADFSEDQAFSFADTFTTIYKKGLTNKERACTTGNAQWDRALLPSNNPTDGGLQPGDMTVVMAPISRGKTTFMVTLAIYNIEIGRDVLYICHEDPHGIPPKVLQSALCCTNNDLIDHYTDPKKFAILQEHERRLVDKFKYVPMMNPGGTYIEDVVDKIQQLQYERIQKTGKGFDLVISDYPAKLLTRSLGRNEETRNKMYFIYGQFADLAAKHGFHALVAVQANRAGARAGRDNERALYIEDVAESWGVPQIATNFICIGQSDEDQRGHKIKFHIDKARHTQRGKLVICDSQFECFRSHKREGIAIVNEWADAQNSTPLALGGVNSRGEASLTAPTTRALIADGETGPTTTGAMTEIWAAQDRARAEETKETKPELTSEEKAAEEQKKIEDEEAPGA